MIVIQNLTKHFGSVDVLKGVHCEIPSNQVVGFLGVNGAGKTTTMRILTTALKPSTGTALINNINIVEEPERVRQTIGYLPEKPPLYPQLKIGQYLEFLGGLRGVDNIRHKIGAVLEQVGLIGKEDWYIHRLSKGYRQRLGLAQALLHDPSVLILDEPASGLDPSQMIEVRSVLSRLAENRTVLLSTHLLTEAERLCDHNILLHDGVVATQGTLKELGERVGGAYFYVEISEADWSTSLMTQLSTVSSVDSVQPLTSTQSRTVELKIRLSKVHQGELLEWFRANHISLRGYGWKRPTLEDIFLDVVGVEQ